jgi:phage terminase small subunit
MSDQQDQQPPPAPPAKRRFRRPFPPVVAPDHPLTKRERLFVAEYLVDLNGAQAAIRAGYAPQNARAQASRLATKANVEAALQAGYKAREARTQITADSTVRAIANLAHSDPGELFDDEGDLIVNIKKLPPHVRACIASVEVVTRNLTSGDGVQERVHKIKWWNKPKALELLGRHQGIFREEQPNEAPACPAFALPIGCSGVSVH